MTAEGRIQSAARWIRGANSLMASAVGTTDVGYDKSRWQRIGDALRAVEYAVKGLVIAVDGRVGRRHNTRELAFHLLARGEDVGVEDLDRMKLDKGREFNAYAEFEEPDFEDLDENRTAEILRAAMRIVSNCERRVRALARQHKVPAIWYPAREAVGNRPRTSGTQCSRPTTTLDPRSRPRCRSKIAPHLQPAPACRINRRPGRHRRSETHHRTLRLRPDPPGAQPPNRTSPDRGAAENADRDVATPHRDGEAAWRSNAGTVCASHTSTASGRQR